MRGRCLRRRLAVLLAVVTAIAIISGCDTSGHRTFTRTDGDGHYSFEYPA